MLHHARVESLRLAFAAAALDVGPAVTDAMVARHDAGEAGKRQAGLQAFHHPLADRLDLGIDQDRQRLALRRRVRVAGLAFGLFLRRGAAGGNMKQDEAQRRVHLRRGEAGAVGVPQRLDHVPDQARDGGRRGVGDQRRRAAEHGMAHPGDLENGHGSYMARAASAVNRHAGVLPGRPGTKAVDEGWRRAADPAILRTVVEKLSEAMIERIVARTALFFPLLFCACLAIGPQGAAAQTLPEFLAENGAWKAYTFAEDGNGVCYMYTEPTATDGNYKRRGDPNAMVTRRQGSKTTEEVSVTSGYPYQPGKPVRVNIDGRAYGFDLIQGEHAWVNDAATDATLVKAMARGAKMTVRGVSRKGTYSLDTYSLMGFTKTRRAIADACP